jgi:hypothetical protein
LREKLKCICQDRVINLYATYRSNSEEWIINRVLAGVSVALMPEYAPQKMQKKNQSPVVLRHDLYQRRRLG